MAASEKKLRQQLREPRIGATVAGYYLERMKTQWGSCNPGGGYKVRIVLE